jgi:hypothetical protein
MAGWNAGKLALSRPDVECARTDATHNGKIQSYNTRFHAHATMQCAMDAGSTHEYLLVN